MVSSFNILTLLHLLTYITFHFSPQRELLESYLKKKKKKISSLTTPSSFTLLLIPEHMATSPTAAYIKYLQDITEYSLFYPPYFPNGHFCL